MRIAIYTSDLTEENRHLMPWRMVLEIGRAACEAGHSVKVLSGRRQAAENCWTYDGCPVAEIEKPYSSGAADHLRQVVRAEGLEVLFWPVAWRSAPRQGDLLGLSIPIVWYLPGACYTVRQAVRAIPDLGMRTAFPFLAQAVYPKKHLLKTLRGPAANLMITVTPFSRSAVCRGGWPAEDVFVIPPGRPAERTPVNGDEPTAFRAAARKLRARPFYLFLGPPAGIRGIGPLLAAFDRLSKRRPDVCLVCLFRSDSQTDIAGVRKKVENLLHGGRTVCVWESVGRADLDAFLEACHAVVLPFLLVPSEIPLAILEAAGYGKPVITTGPGGTADFVREFGLAVPAGRRTALADAMLRLLGDKQLYAQKCEAARRLYAEHPTWEEVARAWLSVAANAVERRARINAGRIS
jgi:glycosyltransferase involved in cell wall biosynthesis